ncbi:ETS homologous factor isoform X2 [Nomia melanderi]|uniref:ETS homologous factor isoform X2 n=1 Tax=Nomia melanderi TaxID=2448451 RepID=UPI00130420B8|nr:ETS homologous factor-like isoform X2 [Nomia melanderi]
MDLFDTYPRIELSEVFPSFTNINDDDDHFLLDMDSLVARKSNPLTTRSCEPLRKKCIFGEENNEIDGTGWPDKPVKLWCQEETISWLMSAASSMGQPYSLIQHSLAVPGRDLVKFKREDFINHDPTYGDRLYHLLNSETLLPSFDTIHPHSEDEYTRPNSNPASDNSIEVSIKRPPGRPRVLKSKKKPTSQGKLWEFIRDLLHNPKTCPSLICWEDYSQAKFRFVKSDDVAKLWGSRKGNKNMTYEKLSRAMRYYYKSKIFLPVLGRRLVYQFGPNAKGWQTENPNFRC